MESNSPIKECRVSYSRETIGGEQLKIYYLGEKAMPNQHGGAREAREFRYEGDILYFKCTKCGIWKTLDDFPNSKVHKFGVRPDCKECYKKDRHENRNKCNDYSKRYYLEHRDELKAKVKNRAINHTEKIGFNRSTFHRKARLYATKYRLKPNKCPICGRLETIEMHHPSYDDKSEWSKVVFCCKFCHRNIHLGLLECPKAIDLLDLDKSINC